MFIGQNPLPRGLNNDNYLRIQSIKEPHGYALLKDGSLEILTIVN